MNSFNNKFFGLRSSFLRIFDWRKWLLVWFVTIFIPCLSEATQFENRNERDEVGNSIVGLNTANHASRMGSGINLDENRSQDSFQPFGPSIELVSLNRPQGAINTDTSAYYASNEPRSQCYNDFTVGRLVVLLLAAFMGAGIGGLIIATFVHLFIVPTDLWVLNKIFH